MPSPALLASSNCVSPEELQIQGEQGRVRDRACVAPRAGRNAAPVDGRRLGVVR